ncbi:MAG: succinylarginine dihydrolase, partial [Candidatus Dadabacteria bacterium]
AWADPGAARKLARGFQQAFGRPLHLYRISERRLPLRSAVATYLFNSQILTLPEGGMAILAPTECRADPEARGILAELVENQGPIRAVHYVHVRQSMRNGGGPACLRLRVVLTPGEFRALHRGVLLTPDLLEALRDWVNRHYRDRLVFDDLRDPQLLREVYTALEELARLLDLGPGFYPSL